MPYSLYYTHQVEHFELLMSLSAEQLNSAFELLFDLCFCVSVCLSELCHQAAPAAGTSPPHTIDAGTNRWSISEVSSGFWSKINWYFCST